MQRIQIIGLTRADQHRQHVSDANQWRDTAENRNLLDATIRIEDADGRVHLMVVMLDTRNGGDLDLIPLAQAEAARIAAAILATYGNAPS